jgi:hypothetical protein
VEALPKSHRHNAVTADGKSEQPPIGQGREQPVDSRACARWFRITERTLASWRKAGMPYWKVIGRNFRYRLSDCEKWMELRR